MMDAVAIQEPVTNSQVDVAAAGTRFARDCEFEAVQTGSADKA